MVWCLWIGFECGVEVGNRFGSIGTEPAIVCGGEDVCRFGRCEEFGPHVKHLFELLVDTGVHEDAESSLSAHGPVQDGINGEPNKVVLLVVRCFSEDVVEEQQHRLVIPDLSYGEYSFAVGLDGIT